MLADREPELKTRHLPGWGAFYQQHLWDKPRLGWPLESGGFKRFGPVRQCPNGGWLITWIPGHWDGRDFSRDWKAYRERPRTCSECQADISDKRPQAVTCSAKCRVARQRRRSNESKTSFMEGSAVSNVNLGALEAAEQQGLNSTPMRSVTSGDCESFHKVKKQGVRSLDEYLFYRRLLEIHTS